MIRKRVWLATLLGAGALCLAAKPAGDTAGKGNKALATAVGLTPRAKTSSNKIQLKSGDTIVAIGDSITEAGGYLHAIDAVLDKQYPGLKIPKVVNKGIGGQKAEDLVNRFEADVVARKPAVAAISIGINDVWHRLAIPHDQKILDAYKANVGKMVDQAQAAGIKVILLAPTIIEERLESEGNRRLPLYVDALRAIAQEKKCQFVDLHGMFVEALKKKPADQKENWLTSDGVHMRPLGDALMAVGVLRALGVPDGKISATVFP